MGILKFLIKQNRLKNNKIMITSKMINKNLKKKSLIGFRKKSKISKKVHLQKLEIYVLDNKEKGQ